jgi:hypothetical protein
VPYVRVINFGAIDAMQQKNPASEEAGYKKLL